MSTLLYNMSAPPRSLVKFEQYQLKKYLFFSPMRLMELLCGHRISVPELAKKVNDYIKSHPDITKNIKKPTGYMIAEYVNLNNCYKYSKHIMDQLSRYDLDECTDLELLIIVFGQTVGDLYIPDKPLTINESKFDKILLFPESEVNS